MKIVIIQEAGRHEGNKNFRESLCLHKALSRIEEVESKVWGLNYTDFNFSIQVTSLYDIDRQSIFTMRTPGFV